MKSSFAPAPASATVPVIHTMPATVFLKRIGMEKSVILKVKIHVTETVGKVAFLRANSRRQVRTPPCMPCKIRESPGASGE